MTQYAKWARRSERSERGQSLVELAILMPIISIVLFGMVDFGVVVSNQLVLNHAAADGARVGAIGDNSTWQSRAQTQALNYLSDVHHCSSPTASADYDEGIPDYVTVTVSCTYQPFTPLGSFVGLIHGSLNTTPTLTGTNTQRVQ